MVKNTRQKSVINITDYRKMNTHYELLAKATLRSNCHQIITKKNKQNITNGNVT